MKKSLIISMLLAFACLTLHAQFAKPFPIPSYNVPVDSAYARFQENGQAINTDASLEKRDVHVIIINRNPELPACQATVWIYSLDGQDILGPYTVICGATLVVSIDERLWGVLVESAAQIEVDVWIE